ncbi:hypothetical protein C900_02004 [Fulvivirga imtechensis AK7]|uniref:FAS1 domain-containing protein n=1 Tax=Fulvivirga imtechensis AK7 TaxID=1237149 RepID=L8JWL4_9BACT|nr:fasciclin domain-containing protein [Fulvivirga imtechensis]ELR72009.1 hypothetical protein C900_02004 [Fulvivirga imtechensis AK7]
MKIAISITSTLKRSYSLILAFLLPFVLLTTGCGDDDSEARPQTIVDVAIANGYNTLAAALVEAELDDELSGTTAYTVFAPTDEAFAALGITKDNVSGVANLEKILLYHVASGTVNSEDLITGEVATLSGENISIDASALTVNGISIVEPFDVPASNGVIHTIAGVLMPSAPNIVETAAATSSLSTLYQLLGNYPDLVGALSGDGPFTVFAPTNNAFAGLLDAIGQDDISNVPEDVVKRILQYHVVAGAALASTDLSDGQTASTVLSNNDQITVGISGSTVTVNNATVTTADVEASNGIVHIIDAVLVPGLEESILNTIVEPAYFSNDFSILTAAVVEADLLSVLIDPAANYTLFAPNDDAFEAAGVTALEGLDLAGILQYHVLGSEVFASDLPSTTGGFATAVTTLNGDFYLTNNSNGVFINGNSQVQVATNSGGALDYNNGVVHVISRTLIPAELDVVGIATNAGFTDLAAALEEAGLVSTLQEAGPFTVFAPTNAAFQTLYSALGIDGPEDVDPTLGAGTLESILTYHVLSGRVFSSDLTDGLEATTVEGNTFVVNVGDAVTLTDKDPDVANPVVTNTDVLAANGVVHIIDAVLLPVDTAL